MMRLTKLVAEIEGSKKEPCSGCITTCPTKHFNGLTDFQSARTQSINESNLSTKCQHDEALTFRCPIARRQASRDLVLPPGKAAWHCVCPADAR
jgi:hypothetical protein